MGFTLSTVTTFQIEDENNCNIDCSIVVLIVVLLIILKATSATKQ